MPATFVSFRLRSLPPDRLKLVDLRKRANHAVTDTFFRPVAAAVLVTASAVAISLRYLLELLLNEFD